MSLQNILDPDAYLEEDKKLYCNRLDTTRLNTENVLIGPGGTITTPELIVTDEAMLGGSNFVTPDTGGPNFVLHTDGAGVLSWRLANQAEDEILVAGDFTAIQGTAIVDEVKSMSNEFGESSAFLSCAVIFDTVQGLQIVGNANQSLIQVNLNISNTDLDIVYPVNFDLIPGSMTAIVRDRTNDAFFPCSGFMQLVDPTNIAFFIYVDGDIQAPDVNRQLELSFMLNFKI
jgi:hypothetical protein